MAEQLILLPFEIFLLISYDNKITLTGINYNLQNMKYLQSLIFQYFYHTDLLDLIIIIEKRELFLRIFFARIYLIIIRKHINFAVIFG